MTSGAPIRERRLGGSGVGRIASAREPGSTAARSFDTRGGGGGDDDGATSSTIVRSIRRSRSITRAATTCIARSGAALRSGFAAPAASTGFAAGAASGSACTIAVSPARLRSVRRGNRASSGRRPAICSTAPTIRRATRVPISPGCRVRNSRATSRASMPACQLTCDLPPARPHSARR